MDTQRFDDLTVTLARGGSRRSLLRGLAGGVLGAVAVERTVRTTAAKARPVNNGSGCAQPGRVCDATLTCCGGGKLTCTTALAASCTNDSQNSKCCAPKGSACHGHCECCSDSKGCFNGVCA
jgi:hypothetical protein